MNAAGPLRLLWLPARVLLGTLVLMLAALLTLGRALRRVMFGALARLFLWIAERRGGPQPDAAQDSELLRPLSDGELQRLNRWLARQRLHDGRLADIHALDGYLACVVVGPSVVPTGEWIGWLFKGQAPAGVEDIVPLMVRHMNGIAQQCAGKPPQYRPLLDSHPELRGMPAPLQAWCRGFTTAAVLRERQWDELRKGETARWLRPIWRGADQPRAKGAAPDLHGLKTAMSKLAARRD